MNGMLWLALLLLVTGFWLLLRALRPARRQRGVSAGASDGGLWWSSASSDGHDDRSVRADDSPSCDSGDQTGGGSDGSSDCSSGGDSGGGDSGGGE